MAESTEKCNDGAKNKAEDIKRFEELVRLKNSLNEKLENSPKLHPHGMACYDPKAIPNCMKEQLEKFKMRVRRDNYQYLSNHPELDAMIELLLQKLIKSKSKDPIRTAAEFFTFQGTTRDEFAKKIEDEVKKIKEYRSSKSSCDNQNLCFNAKVNTLDDLDMIKSLGIGAASKKIENESPTVKNITNPPANGDFSEFSSSSASASESISVRSSMSKKMIFSIEGIDGDGDERVGAGFDNVDGEPVGIGFSSKSFILN